MNLPTNDLITEVLGIDHPVPLGWGLIVETFSPGDNFLNGGEESIFERPDAAKDRDRYQIGYGRVLMIGDAAFKADSFKHWTLIPKVGDYVSYKKYAGVFNANNGPDGKPVNNIDLKDYEVLRIIQNPNKCSGHHYIGA
jgi:co-chaperonin GroES (HSP10)